MSPDMHAMHLANAVMFRTLLDIFVQNAGETREQRLAFQKKLFEQINWDITKAAHPEPIRMAAQKLVASIFGIDPSRKQS